MTTPPAVVVKPFKLKTLIAGIGGLLTVLVPLVTQLAVHLPPEWQAVIGGIIALLTVVGVYQAPYRPPGTVLVLPAPGAPPVDDDGIYENPWKAQP